MHPLKESFGALRALQLEVSQALSNAAGIGQACIVNFANPPTAGEQIDLGGISYFFTSGSPGVNNVIYMGAITDPGEQGRYKAAQAFCDSINGIYQHE
jgi:hypothetical protein